MRIDLPWVWVAALNAALCPLLQLGIAWGVTRMPAAWFVPPRVFAWERDGQFYQRWFRVRAWKGRLPDGAAWFEGGVAKKITTGMRDEALAIFARETWRGELCHWWVMAMTPVFFLWNPWWGSAGMGIYMILANLPCVIALRYNRARVMRRRGALQGG